MHKLREIYDGWDGYQTSLLHAITPLTAEQLRWRPSPDRRSLGELVRHISLGRVTWFARMKPPGMEEVAARVPKWHTDGDGSRHAVEKYLPADDPAVLSEWLALSWQPIQRVLDEWTIDDLFRTFPHRFRGTDYIVKNQWVIWRMISHDSHHGGQIAMMLAIQGIDAPELRLLGGHITEPARAVPNI
jgi:uncharacterized damage-inducible protein DinB